MAEQTKRKKWRDVKARLEAFDRKGLVSLLGELYDASVANRRFLHSRLTPGSRAIEEYRRLVADAIYPDPFSKRPVSVRDAAAAIVDYRRSTGDASGTVDLMLTFVEAGTEQAADLGYGDEAYFNALQIRLDAVAKEFATLPADMRAKVRARLGRIQMRAQDVGWGFSDAVDGVIHALDAPTIRVRPAPRKRRRVPATRAEIAVRSMYTHFGQTGVVRSTGDVSEVVRVMRDRCSRTPSASSRRGQHPVADSVPNTQPNPASDSNPLGPNGLRVLILVATRTHWRGRERSRAST